MVWTKILEENQLPSDTRQVIKTGDYNLLILNHQGKLYALDNRCPHLKLPMNKGKITDDGTIVCPWHRSSFDICTGDVKAWITWPPVVGKAMAMMSQEAKLATFPVKIEEGSIWVDLEA